jgi:RNA-directed DNA polymerase
MKDRTNEEGIDPVTDGPTDDARRRGESESRHGEKHGAPQERTMIEEILEPENLAQAWQRVKANKGAPGIDGMTVEDFPAFAREHWPRIATAIREGNYRPAPVRRVWIPKPDGTKRPLGIPTVLDRVIQQAVAQVLGPLFEVDFSEHSYGYRPGRSAHQAVVVMEESWKEGRRHAVECDLKSFFDTVNHDRLMRSLLGKVRCRKTLGLIRRYLTAGVVLPDGTREATPQGVPQGGPLSPLLANIVLDPLDKELEARGHQFARYADDFIVLVKSANAAKRVLASLIRYCEGRLQLTVNRAKSRAAPLKTCEFLGYRLNQRAKLAWTDKARHRFKERIREITSRNRGHKVQTVIDELNLYTRGWLNYYKLSSTYKEVLALSVWVRRRVRLYYWKQWKQPRTRRRHLLALGADPKTVHMATRSRKGYWRMSQNEIVRFALNNRWLEEQGVPDLRAIWIKLHYGPDARV